MTQQQISTPSVIDIQDSVIKSLNAYPLLGINALDDYSTVLSKIDPHALDIVNIIPAMDGAINPNTLNPYLTALYLSLRLNSRGFILIGQPGSDADFKGDTQDVFNDAIASLPSGGNIAVSSGLYTFSSTVSVPANITILGISISSVFIQSDGNFPVFDLMGERSRIETLSAIAPFATTSPVIKLSGSSSSIIASVLDDFPFLGLQITGSKALVKSCSLYSPTGTSIFFQSGSYQIVESSTFETLAGILIENSNASVLGCIFGSLMLSEAYNIIHPTCTNNKIVANNFHSSISVDLSTDNGTGTILYANTPDTPKLNESNFLKSLKEYVGQPTLTSTDMVTEIDSRFPMEGITSYPYTTNFTHDPLTDKDAATIWSDLDIFVQNTYEERNWYLQSTDPTFDSVGSPLTGIFSWDGSTLSFPDFKIKSLVSRVGSWAISTNSYTFLPTDKYFLVEIDRSLAGIDIPLTPYATDALPLSDPTTAQYLVLAYKIGSNLIWTNGFRLLTAMTSFDSDGTQLPIMRYIGFPTLDGRVTNQIPQAFAGGNLISLSTKLSSQDTLTRNLFEKSNLNYLPHTDANISTEQKAGTWLSGLNTLPEMPSHLCNLQGTVYGLCPASGLYKYLRESNTWVIVAGNPGVPPFCSLSYYKTGLVLLKTNGIVLHFDPDTVTWVTISPTTTISLPFVSSRPAGLYSAGQTDFALQTSEYTLFTTLEGRSIRFNATLNTLDEIPRAYAEALNAKGFVSYNFKDTGYNTVRDHIYYKDKGFNGGNSTLNGLPFGSRISLFKNKPEYTSIKWETLTQENFSFENNSCGFLELLYSGSTFYLLGGAEGESEVLSIFTLLVTSPFTDFEAHFWLLDAGNQEVTALGTNSLTKAFTVVRGLKTAGVFSWVKTTVGAANSCQGAIGVVDYYWDRNGFPQGVRNIHALVSDPSRTNKPTWYVFDRATTNWSFDLLAGVPAATFNNSFNYNYSAGDKLAGWGVACPNYISFLVRDNARLNKPTCYTFDRISTYTGTRLDEVPGPNVDIVKDEADSNCCNQFYGGFWNPTHQSIIWATLGSVNQFRYIAYFIGYNWRIHGVGTGGIYLSTTAMGQPSWNVRSGSLFSMSHLQTRFSDRYVCKIYLWTQSAGLIEGWHNLGADLPLTWSVFLYKLIMPAFSNCPVSTYHSQVGESRRDLSVQVGSNIEPTLPVFGAFTTGSGQNLSGAFWFEPGTKVKNLTSKIWAGLNRGGYFWISNTAIRNDQLEIYGVAGVRGNYVYSNIGRTDDFDFAFSQDGVYVAFVFKDTDNSNRIGLIIYNTVTGSLLFERGGFGSITGNQYKVALGATPRISFNGFTSPTYPVGFWSIIGQDDSRLGGQLVYYRRYAGTAGSAWAGERVGSGGDVAYAQMTANAGKKPKILSLADGSSLIASESGASFELLVSLRTESSGAWSMVYSTSGGGFYDPQFVKTSTTFFAFGGSDGTNPPRIASSLTGTSGWSIYAQTLSSFSRASISAAMVSGVSVIVASSARTDTVAPDYRELLVWNFSDFSQKLVGAFTAKGRLQTSVYSGEEEDTFSDLSWTSDSQLLYSGLRPLRTDKHWSLRSGDWSIPAGESLLGSGRCLTLADSHIKEQWGSESSQDMITEYKQTSTVSWPSLPLAERESGDYLSIKWNYSDSSSSLFFYGNPSVGLTADPNLLLGTLVASGLRTWPLIIGNTQLSKTGSAVLFHGSMLCLLPPQALTNAGYFGQASIGSGNLFKLNPKKALTFNGTHYFRIDSLKEYTLIGPVTYELNPDLALGQHLVLQFNIASSLGIDAAMTPLTGWSDLGFSETQYPLVLGEVREQNFIFYPIMNSINFTYGYLEPREILKDFATWQYRMYPINFLNYAFDVFPVGANSFALNEIGSIKGIQPITFSISPIQLLQKKNLPNIGFYFFQSTSLPRSKSDNLDVLAFLTGVLEIPHFLGEDLTDEPDFLDFSETEEIRISKPVISF
jgi:hypothetical protein